MPKTPSPRVIAAKYVLDRLDTGTDTNFSSMGLTQLAESRVSDAKVEKVQTQLDKLSDKFRIRLRKIVDKFENPPAKPAGKGKVVPKGFAKKK